jgi:FemAB-related protein (PEP-CTERM system-associated)
MKIGLLDQETKAWDRYAASHPQATFFHQSAWREILREAFGHRPHFLYAEQDGAIAGILPLAESKSFLFGHSLISLPFCVYGGPLAESPDIAAALVEAAIDLRKKLHVPALELRFLGDPPLGISENLLPKQGLYATFRRAISADHEENLKNIPRKQRAMVRKGIDRGLTSRADRNVDLAHRIYAESVRNLGTPVFSRRYFRLLAQHFGEALDVTAISEEGTALAAVINFYWRDEVLPYYGGGTAAARQTYANDFMYWEVMRRAADRGARLFDFGRSKTGTGAFAFKKNWGFTPTPLTYYFSLQEGEKMPEVNPLNPKYRLMIAAWKRLPLPLTNLLGPYLVRGAG